MKLKLWVCILVLGLMGCQPQQEQPQQQMQGPMPVPVGYPVTREVKDWNEYTGRFESPTRVEVRARVSGYLEKVHFEDGHDVQQGDILFTLDQRPFIIDLGLEKARLAQFSAQSLRAKNDFERAKRLQESNAISIEELEQRKQAMRVAEAQVEEAQASKERAELNLEYTEVIAPTSGRVSRTFINEGNLITGADMGTAEVTTLLTTIVSDNPLYFYFEASESELLSYQRSTLKGSMANGKKETPVYVKLLDENEFAHEGKVDFLDNEIDQNTGTIQLRAVFENAKGLIQPGMFGRARLPVGETYSAVLIPDGLIRSNQSLKYVYTVGPENMVTPTPVEVGSLQSDGFRVIKNGLTVESMIITGNTQMLRPGMPVDPQQGDGEGEAQ